MQDNPKKNPSKPVKRYPIRCFECGKEEVRPALVSQTVKRNYEGKTHELEIQDLPVTRCAACGEIYYTQDSDDKIVSALRTYIALLSPEEMRGRITNLAMSQREVAIALRIAPETLSRWLSGSLIQSRSMDTLLRAFFELDQMRDFVSGPARNSVKPLEDAGGLLRMPVGPSQTWQRLSKAGTSPIVGMGLIPSSN